MNIIQLISIIIALFIQLCSAQFGVGGMRGRGDWNYGNSGENRYDIGRGYNSGQGYNIGQGYDSARGYNRAQEYDNGRRYQPDIF